MSVSVSAKRGRFLPAQEWVKRAIVIAAIGLAAASIPVMAQAALPSGAKAPSARPIVMLSDIHFDPFHDPGKFRQLQAAPLSRWASILNAPPTPGQAKQFREMQSACHASGVDTDWALLQSSLSAASRRQPSPLFVTLSGDLTVHQFGCRFHRMDPNGSGAAYIKFAVKTASFVALELKHAFPHSPVYISLGNNDSSCGDYRESPDSLYFQGMAHAIAADAGPVGRVRILREFPHLGDYDISLPAPMQHTRMIVLQDIFQSSNYSACNGKPDASAAQRQVRWLSHRLALAKAHGEHVWVMSHIPPGVFFYQTLKARRNVCTGQAPVMFYSSDALANTLEEYAGTVRLVLMGHTHNDEVRLLKPAGAAFAGDGAGEIPVKLTPSITPVHGNYPAFITGTVNPRTATLMDYTVSAASNKTGIDTHWKTEYTWSEAYGLPDFSAASVASLVARMQGDIHGSGAASRDYEQWFAAGEGNTMGVLLRLFWPSYVCSLGHMHAAGYRQCVCGGSADLKSSTGQTWSDRRADPGSE
jgi:sphingomyelin phosphodiesterase acid-like 3